MAGSEESSHLEMAFTGLEETQEAQAKIVQLLPSESCCFISLLSVLLDYSIKVIQLY